MNRILNDQNVFLGLPQDNVKDLFQFLIEHESTGSVSDKAQTLKDVLRRESELSTGFVKGIAIPHSISEGVTSAAVVIGKLKHPIEWNTIDGEPVNLVFLILSPKDSKEKMHLKILAKVAEQLADEDIIEKILTMDSKEMIIKLLKEEI
ncbi:PTS sugar transporter subunit IIA [Enterococcus sp. DIV0756]|uniref:PTS sugar transporter subunit IIA n=1 Tax=Enterococcus sp. DIV0756 TaxID=2774636 RepID=UPI003F27E8F3